MDLYITEKPSVAEALAKYFNSTGANFKKEKNCYKDTKKEYLYYLGGWTLAISKSS